MRRLALAAALVAALAPPAHAQTAKDSARAAAVRSSVDSIRQRAAAVQLATDSAHQRAAFIAAQVLTLEQTAHALYSALQAVFDSLAGTDAELKALQLATLRIDSIETASIAAPPPAPPADTVIAPPPPPPPPLDSLAPALPTSEPAWRDPYPGKPCDVTLASGANANAALSVARGGTVVCLAVGGQYALTTLPPRQPGDTGWVVFRAAALPIGEGQRVRPSLSLGMPRITSTVAASTLLTCAKGAHHYYVAGIEIAHAAPVQAYDLVRLGDDAQTSTTDVCTDVVLSRMYIHGLPTQQLSRCVALNSKATAIVDSWLGECHAKGVDAQAIAGWNGPGPFLVQNNTLQGSGENLMFGGVDPKIPNLIPSDITVRGNSIETPIAWNVGCATKACLWTKKNLLETKNVRRLLIEGNVLDGSWGDGQTGFAFVLKSANQSGRCTWCQSSDITIRGNLIRNVGAGFNLAGREGTNQNPVGGLLSRVRVEGNVVENLGVAPFTGDLRALQIISGATDVTVVGNTFDAPAGNLQQFLILNKTASATRLTVVNNVATAGRYGVFSGAGEGSAAFTGVAGWTFANNALITAKPKLGYPATTLFPVTMAAALQLPGVGADVARVRAETARVVVTP